MSVFLEGNSSRSSCGIPKISNNSQEKVSFVHSQVHGAARAGENETGEGGGENQREGWDREAVYWSGSCDVLNPCNLFTPQI